MNPLQVVGPADAAAEVPLPRAHLGGIEREQQALVLLRVFRFAPRPSMANPIW